MKYIVTILMDKDPEVQAQRAKKKDMAGPINMAAYIEHFGGWSENEDYHPPRSLILKTVLSKVGNFIADKLEEIVLPGGPRSR